MSHKSIPIKKYAKRHVTIYIKKSPILLTAIAIIICFISIEILSYLEKYNNNLGNLSKKILNTPSGDTITFYMNGTTRLPKDVTKNLAGKDINLVLIMDNNIIWTINGMNITKPKSVTLSVSKNTNSIPIDTIKNISDKNSMQISIDYDNEFGFIANLSIKLASKNNGLYANLFYYNPETKKLEFMDYGLIENSMANLKFSHASDYVIIIDSKPLGSPDKTISNIFISKKNNNIFNGIITYPICFAAILIIACFFTIIITEYRQKIENF